MRPSITILLTLLSLFSLTTALAIPGVPYTTSISKRDPAAILTGKATWYGGNLAGGACSFSKYTLPSHVFGTALSSANWDASAACGTCVEVTGPSGKKVIAMIVDECPGCAINQLDLFSDTFSSLASPSEGIISVSWKYTLCPITSPLQLISKSGVSQYWFSMLVVNANEAVDTLEVSTDHGSSWQPTQRQSGYNYFEYSQGFGTNVVDVKVTSMAGNQVIVKDVHVVSDGSVTAGSNFVGNPAPAPVKTTPTTPSENSKANSVTHVTVAAKAGALGTCHA